MKLWIKISLLTGIVMTLAMGVFGGFLIYETGQNNVKQTVENSLQQLQTTAVGVEENWKEITCGSTARKGGKPTPSTC